MSSGMLHVEPVTLRGTAVRLEPLTLEHAPALARVGLAPELLLLTHAFEALHANRAELKTDALNEQSRRAIRRLGAVEEGAFRRHVITASGRVRDTVYFSIFDTEWPAIKARLWDRLR